MGDQKLLNQRFVDTVIKPGKYFDKNGLFLRVKPGGSRKWVFRYTHNGKRPEMGLGNARIVKLSKARERTLKALIQVKDGIDPIGLKRNTKSIPTFEDAALKVFEINRPSWRNEKHSAQFISSLKAYAFPKIGGLKVDKIETKDIFSVLNPIWLSKAETASRVRQRLSTVLEYCKAQKWRSDNPADRDIIQILPKQVRKSNHMKSMDYNEISSFILNVKNSDAGAITKLALEFLILNASRSGEVRHAKWQELNENIWTIPSERMKAGVEHRVPLSERSQKILEEAKKVSVGTEYIFPGYKMDKPLSENTFNKLTKELGYDVHTHGFRTSFKMWSQEKTSVSKEIAEKQLAHSLNNKVEAAYARSDFFEKRKKLMEDWSKFISLSRSKVVSIGG